LLSLPSHPSVAGNALGFALVFPSDWATTGLSFVNELSVGNVCLQGKQKGNFISKIAF